MGATDNSRGCPSCPVNRITPDAVWPVDPLKRMNWVVQPPESTKWGKNKSDAVGAAFSSAGGVVVTRMSCRWLIASRSPTAAMSGAVEAILRIPENGVVNAGKNSSMNRAMWPDAGMVSDSGSPVTAPSRSVNSSETVVGAPDVLVRAMPLRTEWGCPGRAARLDVEA